MRRFLRLYGRYGQIILLVCMIAVMTGCRERDRGTLSIRVLDGWSDGPIENARVVIPETGDVSMTDADGRTEPISVPILYDRHYANILPQHWGTVTLLIYADGYYAQAVYGVRTEKDTVRSDLIIRMFPGDGSMGEKPFVLVESPDSDWVCELLHRYGP